MGIADRLGQWKTIRRRRHTIGQFLSENRIVEVEWRPPIESPLHHEGSTLRLPMDSIIGPRTLAYGHWHDEHTRLIRDLVARQPAQRHFLIDIGANIGLVTRQLLAPEPARWSGACCFEPETKNLAQLAWNLRPFSAAHVQPFAVSDHTGQATLHVDEGNAGDCSLQPLPQNVQRAGTRDETVQLISGAQAWALIQAARAPGDRLVWKSDTQGHDLKIIAAMPDALWDDTDIAMIEVRCNHASPAEIDHLLQVAAAFPQRLSVKRAARPIGLAELEAFCRKRSDSEFDLLLHR